MVSLVLLLLPIVGHADTPRAAADRLVLEGVKLGEAGRYEAAIAKFKDAEARFPRPIHQCNIGLAYTLWRRWPEALVYLDRCRAQSTEPLPAWVSEHTDVATTALEAGRFAPVEVTTRPQDALVTVAGFLADEQFTTPITLWLPFGRHELRASKDKNGIARRDVVITSREAQSVELAIGEGDPAPGPPTDDAVLRFRIAALGQFSFGGASTSRVSQTTNVTSLAPLTDLKSDLLATPGIGLLLELPVTRWLAVGLVFNVAWPKNETMVVGDISRDAFYGIDAIVKARWAFLPGRAEVWLGLPVGVTLCKFGADWERAYKDFDLREVSVGTAVGWNLSLLAGLHWRVVGPLAVVLELGWTHTAIAFDVTRKLSPVAPEEVYRIDVSTDQFSLDVGLSVTF